MNMQMCARCHKRVAVVFITRIENNETINEGICLKCAKELGIKPVNDMLEKMGITEEDFDRVSSDLADTLGDNLPESVQMEDDGKEDGGAPAIDLPKIFQNLGFPMHKGDGKTAGNESNEKNKANDKKAPARKFLSAYCRNLTDKATSGGIDRIVGRNREIDRVIQILCRRQKNNPCLIGEPGVGKTAIAEALAQRIVDGKVPERLSDAKVYLLDLTAIVAGTQFRGQFETRILGLISDVKAEGNVILVIDEVHNIVGAGDAEGSMNAANILKPALSRGEIQVIGATTLNEYRKYIEKDSALERRFQPVMVNEPSIDESVEVLRGIKGYYEQFHGIDIPESVLRSAVVLSERYITDRYLPDKAIDLLDEASSHLSLTSASVNEKRRKEKELAILEREKKAIEELPDSGEGGSDEKYRQLADMRVQEIKLHDRISEIDRNERVTMQISDLADVIEIWTGVPASTIKQNEFEMLDGLEDRIKDKIVGQDAAVNSVVKAIKRKRAGVSYRRSPVSFIFAGPTGVGKTELVKVLANDLFHEPETLIRLDMSEFMEKHSVSKIIGAPPGYVGYDEAGQLTEKIRRRPYSVILFDEIEKAHPDVLNILLQVLDDGIITDARGRRVNFENTLIVMTTNAGSESSSAISGFSENNMIRGNERTERALASFLRPEFINRIDEIITFRHLEKNDFSKIAEIMLGELKSALSERGIKFNYSDTAVKYIAEKSFSFKFGARNMRRFIETNVEDKLAQIIIENYKSKKDTLALDVRNGELEVYGI